MHLIGQYHPFAIHNMTVDDQGIDVHAGLQCCPVDSYRALNAGVPHCTTTFLTVVVVGVVRRIR